MDILNPKPDSIHVRSLHDILHNVAISIIPLATVAVLATPFFTPNPKQNHWHQTFRWSSLTLGFCASVIGLKCADRLQHLKPKIDSLNEQEKREFTFDASSHLKLAQLRNLGIVQMMMGEVNQAKLQAEAVLNPELLEPADDSGYTARNSEVTGGTDSVTDDEVDEVLDAIKDGVSESKIIKEMMGFKGRQYSQGKKILEQLKKDHADYLEVE